MKLRNTITIAVPCMFFLAALLNYGCSKHKEDINYSKTAGYVILDSGKFKLEGRAFYPIALNYMVSIQADNAGIFACSYKGYGPESKHRFTNRDSCFNELLNDFTLVHKMGFNTLRLVGIGEEFVEDRNTGLLSIGVGIGNERDSTLLLNNEKSYMLYWNAIEKLLSIADEAGLKVIFLTRVFHEIPATEEHLGKLTARFALNTTVFAWDLFNEPLYFDSLLHKKNEVAAITSKWNQIVKENSPNHLTTIGLASMREVFEWDPNLVNVDFISFHPYEYEHEQTRNEMYWFSKNVHKPWMIGETAIPADNDSISYDLQRRYAFGMLAQAYNCGAIGFSWWQFKDVEWSDYRANYYGILNRHGETTVTDKGTVFGSPKPAQDAFIHYKPEPSPGGCLCMDNYYNYSSNDKFLLIGKILDEYEQPIEDAVILAWDEYWINSFHSVSKKDGSFELKSSFPLYHLKATATLYSVYEEHLDPKTATINEKNIPFIEVKPIALEKIKID